MEKINMMGYMLAIFLLVIGVSIGYGIGYSNGKQAINCVSVHCENTVLTEYNERIIYLDKNCTPSINYCLDIVSNYNALKQKVDNE